MKKLLSLCALLSLGISLHVFGMEKTKEVDNQPIVLTPEVKYQNAMQFLKLVQKRHDWKEKIPSLAKKECVDTVIAAFAQNDWSQIVEDQCRIVSTVWLDCEDFSFKKVYYIGKDTYRYEKAWNTICFRSGDDHRVLFLEKREDGLLIFEAREVACKSRGIDALQVVSIDKVADFLGLEQEKSSFAEDSE